MLLDCGNRRRPDFLGFREILRWMEARSEQTRAPVSLRDARASERQALEELQWRASTHLTTYRDELLAHPDAIDLPAGQIDQGLVRVAEQAATLVGFAVLLPAVERTCELDGLFVEPNHWRAGVGRLLIEDAMRIASGRDARQIDVIANPDAVAFYQRVGFIEGTEVKTRFGSARRMRRAIDR
jgi:GNAT superfamily N-acetyltransferase